MVVEINYRDGVHDYQSRDKQGYFQMVETAGLV
jgi:hypothetical protein